MYRKTSGSRVVSPLSQCHAAAVLHISRMYRKTIDVDFAALSFGVSAFRDRTSLASHWVAFTLFVLSLMKRRAYKTIPVKYAGCSTCSLLSREFCWCRAG